MAIGNTFLLIYAFEESNPSRMVYVADDAHNVLSFLLLATQCKQTIQAYNFEFLSFLLVATAWKVSVHWRLFSNWWARGWRETPAAKVISSFGKSSKVKVKNESESEN